MKIHPQVPTKGTSKEQGTKNAVQALMRSDLINSGTSNWVPHEEWMSLTQLLWRYTTN